MTDRFASALVKAFRAMADVLESELREQAPASVRSSPPANDAATTGPRTPNLGEPKRRQGVRPVYRPQGPIDEVSTKRADEALKRRGLLPVARK